MTGRTVATRRLAGLLLVVVPLVWSWRQAVPAGTEVVNRGGLSLVGDLLAAALHPQLSVDFLAVVLDAAVVTLIFAALGTAGALVIGLPGGLVLSDAAWNGRPPPAARLLRLLVRGVLVAARSVHELVWALLLVSVLGLDPLAAVLAIAIPFGAQTAKVFAETFDGVPSGPLLALRNAGARPAPALAYGLFPAAAPLLLSYSFYRFECAIRSAVILGVVGVGGLGQELVVSLQSRNWDEVWTLVGVVLLLSAAADLWSTRLRRDRAVVTCSDWSAGLGSGRRGSARPARSRWARWSAAVVVPGLIVAWLASEVSLSGLTSPRTRELTGRLLDDMWPPALPPGGWPALGDAVPDTVAMAILAMAVAVVITMAAGPWAMRARHAAMDEHARPVRRLLRGALWWAARALLLVLRSVPPTVWAVIALLVFFPGVLPGALALGLYTGGILGRLVAEAWESVDTRPSHALRAIGTPGWLASVAAVVPPSAHHLATYTLYRFEVCIRETAVVGVVGAAGLGRLLAENLAAFRFPAVTTLLIVSFALSVASELFGRRLRRALRAS
ncbi:ABC transporter permease [Micromonospora sp. Llam0]|uniref:PhnE/PtxC family ABC transporter permease n=1 Tax=Micromonospora sp. Llam0 TaxID=2485143 RepID=UPI0013154C8A|nr:ABC transporter permease subunit [Micromonospora sp. Llam0]